MAVKEGTQCIKDCSIGEGTKIWNFVNLYGCSIGKNCLIGSFVEIQSDVEIGDGSRIQSHTFIASKARIGNNCSIGHSVMFINDRYPLRREEKFWEPVIVKDNVVIGSNATILPCVIGENSVIAAGSVVTKDVQPNTVVAGNPARPVGCIEDYKKKQAKVPNENKPG